MNSMDTDNVVDIPDTPDRLVKPVINEQSASEEENRCSSRQCHLVSRKCSEERTEIPTVDMDSRNTAVSILGTNHSSRSGRLLHSINLACPPKEDSSSFKNIPQPVDINGGIKILSSGPPICTSSSSTSLCPCNSAGFSVADSSSYKSLSLFRKKIPTPRGHDIHSQHLLNETCSFNSKNHASSLQDTKVVGPTERSSLRPGFLGIPGCGRSRSSNETGLPGEPLSHSQENISTALSNASVEAIDLTGSISNIGRVEGGEMLENVRNNPVVNGCIYLDPIAPPRINKQKRLVRNGCVSPCNIAKARHLTEKCKNAAALDNNSVKSGDSSVSVDIREIVSENHTSLLQKGKGVIIYPSTSKEPELKNKHSYHRSSSTFNKNVVETSDYIRGADKYTEETGEWRSTHHRTREFNPPSSTREFNPPSSTVEHSETEEMEVLRSVCQRHENRMARKGKGSSVATDDDNHKDRHFISSAHVSHIPPRSRISHPRTRLGQLDGHPFTANKFIKRQEEGSISRNIGEFSMPVSDDSEVVVLSSSAEPSNITSTSGNHLPLTIEVDSLFPDLNPNSHDENARVRQVESDELLARELQVKLYNDEPVPGVGEVDEQIAAALQHEFNSNHASSSRLISSLRRQTQSRPSSNLPRRGSHARASIMGRMTSARSRFPGQSRTLLPSRRGTSLFPANMDLDMRMDILGALEAFSDMEVGTEVLRTHRDFNENDYETLLALDENIGQHGGASVHQINGLPQSTIQNSNFDEACAICLETPTIGDTIRHLPCLHKFHKDCIDPWLQRKTACPICKSSIT